MTTPKEDKTTEEKIEPEQVEETPDQNVILAGDDITNTDDDKSAVLGGKKLSYYYAIGRRKSSIAQIRLYKKGGGEIKINDKNFNIYFPREEWQSIILSPLKAMGQLNKLNVVIKVRGGGVKAQSEAIRLGISRALLKLNPIFKRGLKKYGFLTRDPRVKERKKPGLKKARKAPQWQKR